MKKIGLIILKVLLSLIAVIGLVYSLVITVLELRLVFSFEWVIYDNYLNGLFRYIFRALIGVLGIVVCFFEIKNINNKKEKITSLLFVGEVSLFIIAIILLFQTTNYVGLASFALVTILLILKNLIIIIDNKLSYKNIISLLN